MKILEKFLGLLAITSVILKFFMVSYSGMVFSVCMTSIALLYYPLGFIFFNDIPLSKVFKKEAYKGKSTLKIIGALGLGLALSVLCNGILFKLEGFPMSGMGLKFGLFLTSAALLVVIYRLLRTKRSFYRELLNRIAIIGAIGLILLFVSDVSIAEVQFRNNPEGLKAYKEHMENVEKQKTEKKQFVPFER